MLRNLDEYHYYDTEYLSNQPIMIEVGAFDLCLAMKFIEQNSEAKVYVYEASPTNFNELTSKIVPKNIKTFNKALSQHNGYTTIYEYDQKESSSMFERRERKLVKTFTVEAETLSNMLMTNEVEKLDYLLLNCEGAELYALEQIVDLNLPINQMCVSFHCRKDSEIYPSDVRDTVLELLKPMYTIHIGNERWGYYLLRRRERYG